MLLAILIPTALAQSPPEPSAPPPASEVTSPQPPEERPFYVLTRGAFAVPFGAKGDIPAASIGLGLDIGDGQTLGLRAVYMHDIPTGSLAGDDPPPYAWGPVIDYNMGFEQSQSRGAYLHLSAGFVYGTPEGGTNMVVPVGEVGMGLEFRKRVGERELFIAPELGMVPSLFNEDGPLVRLEAPYAAVNVGVMSF